MLYICATPIGNLNDISIRALEVLSSSDIILCEDTRTSKNLLAAHSINYKKLIALHQHNENEIAQKVIGYLAQGMTITQISDAGTPGISDPGARLCRAVLNAGYQVSPIPGACAYVSLLSVSGLDQPSLFYGFLPSTQKARLQVLEGWVNSKFAVLVYEAPHRIAATLTDIVSVMGNERKLMLGRELTKQFETIKYSSAAEMLDLVQRDLNQQRGEIVLLIYPAVEANPEVKQLTDEQIRILKLLLPELPPKKAVSLTHQISGADKDLLYRYAIETARKPYVIFINNKTKN